MDLRKTEEEKMAPWLAAITDTLEVLHKGDENPVSSRNYIMEKANVQFKSVERLNPGVNCGIRTRRQKSDRR